MMPENSKEKMSIEAETILCPLCGKGEVEIIFTPGYTSWHVTRIASKTTREKKFHGEKYKVQNKCSECGATRTQIREALERGRTNKISHEDRIKRIRESGMPTILRSTIKQEE